MPGCSLISIFKDDYHDAMVTFNRAREINQPDFIPTNSGTLRPYFYPQDEGFTRRAIPDGGSSNQDPVEPSFYYLL